MKSSFISVLSALALSGSAAAQACLNCTSPIANSNWANGVLAGGNYYAPQPDQATGRWSLGTSSNGEGPLELRFGPLGGGVNGYYVWNQCPRGHSGYCRVYLNQVVPVEAGVTYNFLTEYQLSNVRGNTANTMELYIETLPSRQRLFNEYTYAANTAWTTWTTTGQWVAPRTENVLFTYTWRNDPNDAVVNLKRIDMKPVACRLPNPATSCAPSTSTAAPTSTSTSSESSSTPASTSTEPTSSTTEAVSSTEAASTSEPASSTTEPSSTTETSSSAEPTYTPPYPPVQGYDWVDCWQEPSTGGRLLRGSSTAADDMTLDKCATFCSAWPYFGTEYGRECYCGLFVSSGGAAAPLADCSFPCAGDATQNCGAGNRVSLYYHKTKPRPESPSTLGDSTRFGCLTDSRDGRTLSVAGPASDDMTLESCATFCAGYKFWGVEYGRECYCGNEMLQTAVQVENSECDMLCLGNSAELCGAGDRVMVYARDE